MLQIYAYKPNNLVEFNDIWFERNTYNRICTEDVKGPLHTAITRIEQVEFADNERIYSKITGEPISLSEISTGCKTILNIMCFPDKPFLIYECGENYIHEVYLLQNGLVYSPEFIWTNKQELLSNTEFLCHSSKSKQTTIHGISELERWYIKNGK